MKGILMIQSWTWNTNKLNNEGRRFPSRWDVCVSLLRKQSTKQTNKQTNHMKNTQKIDWPKMENWEFFANLSPGFGSSRHRKFVPSAKRTRCPSPGDNPRNLQCTRKKNRKNVAPVILIKSFLFFFLFFWSLKKPSWQTGKFLWCFAYHNNLPICQLQRIYEIKYEYDLVGGWILAS